MEAINLKVVVILTIGFGLASLLGYFSLRFKFSPILGYLIAGYMIGPFFPGFVADLQLAEQLAEVGVMLMMFGVGLHFKWQDLASVKGIAIPGAILQTFMATVAAAYLFHKLGGGWETGILIGLAIGVASTVVLVRVLSDFSLLNSLQGHIAVGWLIVEDILTVIVLILLPTITSLLKGSEVSIQEISSTFLLVLFKLMLLAALMFTLGRKIVSYALLLVARTRSHELFTLSILALTFIIATGSAYLFGTSIALGAFIAGMVIGQTDVKQQAAVYSSPMKDVFVVIFFLSVGMLFNPSAIIEHFSLFLVVLFIVLAVKPITAFILVMIYRYPMPTAASIAFALAQIGEFSFILAEEASKYGMFPDEAFDVIVACALISISINPFFFKLLHLIPTQIGKIKSIAEKKFYTDGLSIGPLAIVIGYGIVGKNVVNSLKKKGFKPTIIDRNVDTITNLLKEKEEAIFGDASHPDMLTTARLEEAKLLVITIPKLETSLKIIQFAREINPLIHIIARAHYVEDKASLKEAGVNYICCEEEDVAASFNRSVLSMI
jgi:CPA2 family monovalent cation:H+ antiporter-2